MDATPRAPPGGRVTKATRGPTSEEVGPATRGSGKVFGYLSDAVQTRFGPFSTPKRALRHAAIQQA